VAAPDDPLPPDVRAALDQGDALEAIKLLRRRTGFGLKEAKDAVERGPKRRGAAASGLSPGEVPRSAGFGRWLLVAAIVVAGLYFALVQSAPAA
jgi:hypothetical protein